MQEEEGTCNYEVEDDDLHIFSILFIFILIESNLHFQTNMAAASDVHRRAYVWDRRRREINVEVHMFFRILFCIEFTVLMPNIKPTK